MSNEKEKNQPKQEQPLSAEEIKKQQDAFDAEKKELEDKLAESQKEAAEKNEELAKKQQEIDAANADKTPKKEEVKEVDEPVDGSVKESYTVPPGEEGLVHYILTDYASPRPKDLSKDFKPRKRVVKTTPEMFVRQFSDNFNANDAFADVNTPGRIVSMHLNLSADEVKTAYADDIHSATQGKPSAVSDMVKRILESKADLKLVGGNQVIKKGDVLHIPTNNHAFPFEVGDLKQFPKECMH